MLKIQVNGVDFFVNSGLSVLESCESIGIDIPRFCYHSALSVAGNCRMCLIEVLNSPKPVAACAFPVTPNMSIFTNSPLVKKARENILEALLLNHPLDCPICDQGGECDLQDQTKSFGKSLTRFFTSKRSVANKNVNTFIKTIMTRCIHCTRCVRFNTELSGAPFFGTLGRGTTTEIGSYITGNYKSTLSANIIDLCPVGALTSKNYAFKARPWELRTIETLDLTDGTSTQVYASLKESNIVRVFPKSTPNSLSAFISDRARFYFDANKTNRLLEKPLLKSENLFGTQVVLVNNSIDLGSLNFFKHLSNYSHEPTTKSTTFFRVKAIQGPSTKLNYYSPSTVTTEGLAKANSFYLILSSNLAVESVSLNLNLTNRLKFDNITAYGFASNKLSLTQIEVLSVNLKNIGLFLESKIFNIAKYLTVKSHPVVIFSPALAKRGINFELIKKKLLGINNTAIFFAPTLPLNTAALQVLNVGNITRKDFNAVQVLACDLEDSFVFKKYHNSSKSLIWFNTHSTSLFDRKKSTIKLCGIPTGLEEELLFINAHGQLQQTTQIVTNNTNKTQSIKGYLLEAFKETPLLRIRPYNKHLKSFKEKINVLTRTSKFNLTQVLKEGYKSVSAISFYPNKDLVEDPFLTNKLTKNSRTLYRASWEYRGNRK
jgi:hypothetical protein